TAQAADRTRQADWPRLYAPSSQLAGGAQLSRHDLGRRARIPRTHGPLSSPAATRAARPGLRAAQAQLCRLRGLPQCQTARRSAEAPGTAARPEGAKKGRRRDRRTGPGHRRAGAVRAPAAPRAGPGVFHGGRGRPLRPRHELGEVAPMMPTRLFTKALLQVVLLFGLTAVAAAVVAAWALDQRLTQEFESKGRAIAEGLAASSADTLVNRDAAT